MCPGSERTNQKHLRIVATRKRYVDLHGWLLAIDSVKIIVFEGSYLQFLNRVSQPWLIMATGCFLFLLMLLQAPEHARLVVSGRPSLYARCPLVVPWPLLSASIVLCKLLLCCIQKFGFINGVDNVNWPPYRDSKWITCSFYSRVGAALLAVTWQREK